MNIDETLEERGTRYGSFPEHARITQDLKRVMARSPKWDSLKDDQKEALEMIAHKIGRILNGDPDYHDSWHDIVGYTKLVADRLLVEACRAPTAPTPRPYDDAFQNEQRAALAEELRSSPAHMHAAIRTRHEDSWALELAAQQIPRAPVTATEGVTELPPHPFDPPEEN